MKRLLVLLPALLALQVGVSPALAWTWPAEGPVLQTFRLGADPYEGGQHRGVDVGGSAGTPVMAPAGGTVSFAGTVPGGGLVVTIQTADGYSVTLVHLGTVRIERGAVVGEGEVVGSVGPSGTAELPVPYVHLGIRVTEDENGYLDPVTFLPPRAVIAPAPGSLEEGAALPEVATGPGADVPPAEISPGPPEPASDDARQGGLPEAPPAAAVDIPAAPESSSAPERSTPDGVGDATSPARAPAPAGEVSTVADAAPAAPAKALPQPRASASESRSAIRERHGGGAPASARAGAAAFAHGGNKGVSSVDDARAAVAEPAGRSERPPASARPKQRAAVGKGLGIGSTPESLVGALYSAPGAKTVPSHFPLPEAAAGTRPAERRSPAADSGTVSGRGSQEGWLSLLVPGFGVAIVLGLLTVVAHRRPSVPRGPGEPATSRVEPGAAPTSAEDADRPEQLTRPALGREVVWLLPAERGAVPRLDRDDDRVGLLDRPGDLRPARRLRVEHRCSERRASRPLPRRSRREALLR